MVFSYLEVAKDLLRAAIKHKIRNKVWIAGEGWSMNKHLQNEPGIQNIGNILGITEKLITFPGFKQFIYSRPNSNSAKSWTESETHPPQSVESVCNQDCQNCSLVTSEEIFNEDSTYSFAIYAAIYTMARALHKVLHCDANGCNKTIPVYPFMVCRFESAFLSLSIDNTQ